MSEQFQNFLIDFARYDLGWRAFGDICLQHELFRGPVEQQKEIYDETCRLALYVDDESGELIERGRKLFADLRDSEERDDQELNDLTFILNYLEEDRSRASDYTKAVVKLKLKGEVRPRPPQVANPFIPLIDGSEPCSEEEEQQEETEEEEQEQIPAEDVPEEETSVPDGDGPLADETRKILEEPDGEEEEPEEE